MRPCYTTRTDRRQYVSSVGIRARGIAWPYDPGAACQASVARTRSRGPRLCRADRRRRAGGRRRVVAGALQSRVQPHVRRVTEGLPDDPPARACRLAPAQHRPVGERDLPRRRAGRARVVHHQLQAPLRQDADGVSRELPARLRPGDRPCLLHAPVRSPATQHKGKTGPRRRISFPLTHH
jgi:hypothetical protein